jgi:hypothetical protein
MSQGNAGPERFVPSGVDAQSWIGFEHRIQERRFKALVDTINGAIAQRDGIAARVALEEARELRPNALELEQLSARVALLPVRPPSSGASSYIWSRGLGAVAMFVVGIGLVIGLEWVRSEPNAAPDAVVATAIPAASDVQASPASGPVPALPVETVPAEEPIATPAPEQIAAPATPAVTPSVTPVAAPVVRAPAATDRTTREEPVGTAGAPRASSVDAARPAVPNRSTFRPAAETAGDRGGRAVDQVLPASREIPDDYVAAGPRSENRPAFTETAAPAPAIAASVAPQPVSVTAPPVLPAGAANLTATTAVTPRSDNTRVAQVLNQYARAYERLDPTAARAVWPTVDERALTRAFASLESQDVSFDRCDIDVKGNVASASCRGTASYVGKIGNRQPRTEARQWNFELKLHGDDWKIEKAQALAR